MIGWKIVKVVGVLILLFPFVLMFSFWGSLVFLTGFPRSSQPSMSEILAVGSAVGLVVGTLVGYGFGR